MNSKMDDLIVYRIDENHINYEAQEEDYDPYLNREPKPTITNFQALFLLIQGFLGTGLIQAVFVYKEGWLTGTIYTILVGILCNHCLHILLSSKYRLCKFLKVPQLSYGGSMERALETGPPCLRIFSRISHFIADTCLILCQMALCCTYSSTAISLVPIVGDTFLKEWFNLNIGISILFFVSLVPLVLAVWIKDLRVVAAFCLFGVILSFSAVVFFYWYALEDLPSFGHLKIEAPNVANLPAFLGPIFLSLEAITVVSIFEGELESPKKFKRFWGIFNFGMLVIIVFQCSIGFLGYLKFGNANQGSVFAISYQSDQRLKICIFLYAVALYVSYGLQGYILVDFLWKKTERRRQGTKNCLRILLLLMSFGFLVVRSLEIATIADHIIKIILTITVPVLGIVFPAILEICVKWPHDFRRANYFLCKNFFLIFIGILIVLVSLVNFF